MGQDFLPFQGWVIFYCKYRPHFVYSFIVNRHLGYLYLLAFVNSAAMNEHIQISVQVPAFVSLAVCPQVAPLDHMVVPCLICWGITTPFSAGAAPSYMLTSSAQGFQFFHILSNTCYSFFKYFIYLFLENRGGREKKRERNMGARGISSIGCFSHAPTRGPGLQPRHVPWLAIELETFWFTGWHSIPWATPARAIYFS